MGTYEAHGFEPAEATILVFDKVIHVGHRNPLGQTITEVWNIADVSSTFNPL